MIGSIFTASAYKQISNDYNNIATINIDDPTDIRVAIYTEEKETDPDFYGPYGRTRYFMWALKNYIWKSGNTLYRFEPTLLSNKQFKGTVIEG